MIQFEIIRSPDLDIQNLFTFFQNLVYIGRNKGHVLIEDQQLYDSHLILEIIDHELMVHPQTHVTHYLIDGKRATSIRKIKTGQTITIGETELKIKDFKETTFKTKKNILDEKLAFLMEQESPRLSIIEQLAGMMK